MDADYTIAIIGSGPSGMSAAARAAKTGLSHILLERRSHLTDTIFNFHKRKHVMATPELLPLRSDLGFKEGAREEVIETWERGLEDARVKIRTNAEVTAIKGQCGGFEIALADGDTLTAEHVVLAIGVQGNPRKLAIPGADLPFLQYQLDDPDEYRGEEIIVVGSGDAAIENALALADGNHVTIVNRGRDFPRARPANAARIRSAINRGIMHEVANARPKRLSLGCLVLETAAGDVRLNCDRVIARIGTEARPQWLASSGITFASDDPDALPRLSETYESEVPGLYVIGAIAGFPLIKHCLKQGYEVVEYIRGSNIPPIDEPLLQDMLARAGVPISVGQLAAVVQQHLRLYAPLTRQQVRECLVRSEIRLAREGDVVFRQNDYTNSLYSILVGEVRLEIDPANPREIATLKPGQFFGEMELDLGTPARDDRDGDGTLAAAGDRAQRDRPGHPVGACGQARDRRRDDDAPPQGLSRSERRGCEPRRNCADGRARQVRAGRSDDQGRRRGRRRLPHPQGLGHGVAPDRRPGHGRGISPGRKLCRRDGDAAEGAAPCQRQDGGRNRSDQLDGAVMRALLDNVPALRREIEERLALRLKEQHGCDPMRGRAALSTSSFARASAKRRACCSSTRRSACAATIARRPVPKRTAG